MLFVVVSLVIILKSVDDIVNLEAVQFHHSVKVSLNVCVFPDSFDSADVFFHIAVPPGFFNLSSFEGYRFR